MTIHLPTELENSVRAEVLSGRFASEDELVVAAVRDYLQRKQAADAGPEPRTPPKRKPLWERAAELRQSIPAEEWDKVPTDGARQLDHYIHGASKRADP